MKRCQQVLFSGPSARKATAIRLVTSLPRLPASVSPSVKWVRLPFKEGQGRTEIQTSPEFPDLSFSVKSLSRWAEAVTGTFPIVENQRDVAGSPFRPVVVRDGPHMHSQPQPEP